MEKKGWKTLTIVFIILFIVETITFVWLINLGLNSIENESKCVYNICADYDTYYYNNYEDMCYCFIDGEIKHQEYLK